VGLLQEVLAQVTGQRLQVKVVVEPGAAPALSRPSSSKDLPAVKVKPEPGRPADPDAEPGFNPCNTFDTFVVGDGNSFAHGAALAVAKGPGEAYNPLFVYGGVGLGKTHLLHAIGQYVSSQRKNAKVAYLSCERFTNEFIDALQTNQLVRFRRRYRQLDMVLIDDVQFLANKERIQEEFFHTFNALYESRKQIVLACDRPAGEIENLEHRLVSRFEWGLVTDLHPPDMETRLAILRKKEEGLGVRLPPEVQSFLAERIHSNVRRLEGAMIRVVSFAALTGKPLNPQVVGELLQEVLQAERRNTLTIEQIQRTVAEHYDIRLADMTSRRRPESIAFPRQIAMYLARKLTNSSLNTIGEAFGGRDHGTVLHACRQVGNRMDVDANVKREVGTLEKELQR
jgi:chromosomal replication initiator protein